MAFCLEIDFTFILSPPYLGKLTFWVPAFARMTGLQAQG